jgi:hypothetical protein
MTADEVAKDIVDAAIKVHRGLRSGASGISLSGLLGARTTKTSAPRGMRSGSVVAVRKGAD